MRPELEGKTGQEYFAAWRELMRQIGDEVKTYYLELAAWMDDKDRLLDETGLIGAVTNKFDLPIKTTTKWLEDQGAITIRGYYELVISAYNAADIHRRGRMLEDARTAGQSYAAMRADERAAIRRQVEERERAMLEKTFQTIDKAMDKDGKIIRVGDTVRALLYGKPREVKVKELRIRAGKKLMPRDQRVYYELDGHSYSAYANECELMDKFYGE